MAKLNEPPADRPLIVQLRNAQGLRQLRFDPPASRSSAARKLWVKTAKGTIGHSFRWAEADGSIHQYEVIDKRVWPDAITIMCVEIGEP